MAAEYAEAWTGPSNTRAEIVPGSHPEWYVLITHPGQERTAAGHLIGRGFGVYLPECETGRNREKLPRPELMFKGYLFLFVWGLHRQWSRILSVPGAYAFLSIEDRPAVLPEALVDRIRIIENLHRPLAIQDEAVEVAAIKAKGRKKRWRKSRKPFDPIDDSGLDIVDVRAFSAFKDLPTLDESDRKGLLHRALGLGS